MSVQTQTQGIASWPEEERPRERLLSHGAEVLGDAELVAILLRVGVQGLSAVAMGRALLERFGSLEAMTAAPLSALLEVKGVKKAKAAQLKAAMEIARRVAARQVAAGDDGRRRITGTAQAGEYFLALLRDLPEEHFRVLYLNRQNALLEDSLVSRGDVAAVSVSIRRVLTRALQINASALIAAHNHPAGSPQPSESDRLLTKDLIAATRPISIRVLDHIIVGGGEVYSFADNGLLDELEIECMAPGVADRAPSFARNNQ